ncbi:hypothetical protein [Chamaesiphon minutus]|uniref:Uncharacterized protein n=1 Tax=Chamaesiphon minutus (strain ATCC 27169 / PCC 6605) TaxID=1173020 RepID=K9UJH6_CHAP6|nr:hypothetical protein [Chamaesiphon minutus]AFY94975.1 hypothetical protein Cha6605_4014 [Chamaesiphon minutus PCC 6605]
MEPIDRILRKYLFNLVPICFVAISNSVMLPQPVSAQTTKECDRIYNLDTSTWTNENLAASESKARSCYTNSLAQLSTPNRRYSIRERNLRKAMRQVQNTHYRQNGTYIQVNRNNIREMMKNIGATPSERRFVIQQMSLYQ